MNDKKVFKTWKEYHDFCKERLVALKNCNGCELQNNNNVGCGFVAGQSEPLDRIEKSLAVLKQECPKSGCPTEGENAISCDACACEKNGESNQNTRREGIVGDCKKCWKNCPHRIIGPGGLWPDIAHELDRPIFEEKDGKWFDRNGNEIKINRRQIRPPNTQRDWGGVA